MAFIDSVATVGCFLNDCWAWFTLVAVGLCGVWTKYGILFKEQRAVSFVNDLGFSLYAMLFTCYMVATSKK